MRTTVITVIALVILAPLSAFGQSTAGRMGIQAGVGTDIELGLGFGVGLSYVWIPQQGGTALELAGNFFYHKSTTSTTEQVGVFVEKDEEKTQLVLGAVRASGLFNYYPRTGSVFFIAGFGFVVANIKFEESETYTSTSPGVSQSPNYTNVDETSVGNVINLGIGYVFKGGRVELRLETPMLYFYRVPGNATAFVPTFTFTVGVRF